MVTCLFERFVIIEMCPSIKIRHPAGLPTHRRGPHLPQRDGGRTGLQRGHRQTSQQGRTVHRQQGTQRRNTFFCLLLSVVVSLLQLWNTHHEPHRVEEALRDTLDKLGLKYLDLYYMHHPEPFQASTRTRTDGKRRGLFSLITFRSFFHFSLVWFRRLSQG